MGFESEVIYLALEAFALRPISNERDMEGPPETKQQFGRVQQGGYPLFLHKASHVGDLELLTTCDGCRRLDQARVDDSVVDRLCPGSEMRRAT